jgi:L-aminoadipate-semialdehyde dehydrogenase
MIEAVEDYAGDAKALEETLPSSFPSADSEIEKDDSITVFLTGATGFLGAHLPQDLLTRQSPQVKAIIHIRTFGSKKALDHVAQTCQVYGVWDPSWTSRIQCVTGSLGEPKLGLSEEQWKQLANEASVVIHNGSQVYWAYPYSNLKPANSKELSMS